MVCGLPARRYFQGIWCSNGVRAANPQVLSRHLVLEMLCGLPMRRYFQGIWCLKCCAGCHPAGTFKAFGAWNALRAASPQVLSRHLMLEVPCGLPTCRYFQGIWCWECPAGCQPARTFKAFGAWNALRAAIPQVLSRHLVFEMLLRAANPQALSRHLVLEMVCGLPTRRYFQGIWCLKWCAGCQPAGTFKAFGA